MTEESDDNLVAPFGCLTKDKLRVVTRWSDLGYGHGKSGNWWALRAFSAMCDQQEVVGDKMDQWAFPAAIALAVERILADRGRQLTMVDEVTFERGLRLCREESAPKR